MKIKKAAQVIAAIAFYAAIAWVVYHLFWGSGSSSVAPTASCRDGTQSSASTIRAHARIMAALPRGVNLVLNCVEVRYFV
jgi:hypothetical protein